MSLPRSVERPPPPPTNESRRERPAGVALFLAVTGCWLLGSAAAEQDWITFEDFFVLIAAGLSAVSVVITGYLGRYWDALWLGWIPGATMMAMGFSMTPTPGGDDAGAGSVFVGGLLLMIGWPAYFLPLIAIGVTLRRWRVKRLASNPPSDSIQPQRESGNGDERVSPPSPTRAPSARPVNRRVSYGIGTAVLGLVAAYYLATVFLGDRSTPTNDVRVPAEEASPGPVGVGLCKKPGIRYAGATTQGAEVCLTLTPNGKELVETGYSFILESGCPDRADGEVYSDYPGTVDASGHIDYPKDFGFTATIDGARASGVLEDPDICPGEKFEWSARRER